MNITKKYILKHVTFELKHSNATTYTVPFNVDDIDEIQIEIRGKERIWIRYLIKEEKLFTLYIPKLNKRFVKDIIHELKESLNETDITNVGVITIKLKKKNKIKVEYKCRKTK